MSRIFLSHSSIDNVEAVALRDWLVAQGWDDLFLDLDPERGLKAGERWQAALKQAAERCEMVIFLVSPAWAASKWCLAEFLLAKQLNKRIFGVIIEPTPFVDLPSEMTAEWQMVDLTAGTRKHHVGVMPPPGNTIASVAFALDGLDRLRIGLMRAGLEARYFAWPPEEDPDRLPYRGLKPLEVGDAGIFFGRDGPIVIGLDMLRGLREAAPPRLLVILGASGAGKSSFVRAGLWPRLAREDHHFIPLPVMRPERNVLAGEAGLIAALEAALKEAGLARTRAEIRTAVATGAAGVAPLLTSILQARTARFVTGRSEESRPPTLVLCIDQAEELFLVEAGEEACAFLELLRDLTAKDSPALIVLLTIRSDNYERLQTSKELGDARHHTMSLPPMPRGEYAELIRAPARRLEGSKRPLKIEDPLVAALLLDIEEGGAKDTLPLLAFTLERLYREQGGDGDLKLSEYEQLGRVKGSIEAAVEHALNAADADARIPANREARLTLLRRGLIPWLASIDHDTGTPRRRLARLSEIPLEARPLVDHLVEQRLLSTDVSWDTGEKTIEPAHEALLRQWGVLKGWLVEDSALLAVLDGIKRGSRDWVTNTKATQWLAHSGGRLAAVEQLLERPDLAANLDATDREYILACQSAELKALQAARFGRRARSVLALVLLIVIAIPAFSSVYLPIAEIPVSVFLCLAMGASAGFLTGMFGIIGASVFIPLLIFLGVPPSIAVGTASAQIMGSSISSVHANAHGRNLGLKLSAFLLVGGAIGAWTGVDLVRRLLHAGQFEFFLTVSYVIFLTVIAALTLAQSSGLLRVFGERRWPNWQLPIVRLRSSQPAATSSFLLLALGTCGGLLAAVMGLGGTIILAPAIMYFLRISDNIALSTASAYSVLIATLTTIAHATINLNVDIVLAATLLIGGLVGAPIGAKAAEQLRNGKSLLQLAAVLTLLATDLRMVWHVLAPPSEAYSVISDRQAQHQLQIELAPAGPMAGRPPRRDPPSAQEYEMIQAELFARSVALTASFKGIEITVFGAVDNSKQKSSEHALYDIVVVLEGTPTTLVVRRKSRVAGVWVNTASVIFYNVPSHYTVATTRPLNEIAEKELLALTEIGFDQIRMSPSIVDASGSTEALKEYRDAIVRIMQRNGLYTQEKYDVIFFARGLFRSTIDLAGYASVGPLIARVYLFREGTLLSTHTARLTLDGEGALHFLRDFAYRAPLLYGMATVLLAAIAGLVASALSRQD